MGTDVEYDKAVWLSDSDRVQDWTYEQWETATLSHWLDQLESEASVLIGGWLIQATPARIYLRLYSSDLDLILCLNDNKAGSLELVKYLTFVREHWEFR